MNPEDNLKNVPRKELNTSSSDDDANLPLRKRIKTDSGSDESSSQEDCDTSSGEYTQESTLTSASGDTTESLENSDQQDHPAVPVVHDANNSLASGQNTLESLQTDVNDSASDDTHTNSVMNLENTLLPETRYVIPQNLLYRPSINDFTMKHNISYSVNEGINKHDKPNLPNDISPNIEQIRQNFVRAWDQILAADDLIPDTQLETLDSTIPAKICQYMDELGAVMSSNEALRELAPRVREEIQNLQQANQIVGNSETAEPEPIPISDFLTDPLDLLETGHQQPTTNEEFDFDTEHWYRIQQAFTLPSELPEFNQLFSNTAISIPNRIEERLPEGNMHDLTDVSNELAYMYNTIMHGGASDQQSHEHILGQSAATRDQSGDPYLSNFLNSNSNLIQQNYEQDVFRSVLGITAPFEQNENTFSEEIAMPVLDTRNPVQIPNRSGETERLPTQIFSRISEVGSNLTEFDITMAPVELRTHPVESETNHAEFETNPAEMDTNPADLETNMNYAQLNTSPIRLTPNPVDFGASSNEEDNDSPHSRSDAYDGSAQFVVLPRRNNFKPVIMYVVNPGDGDNAHIDTNNEPTEETTSDENTHEDTSDEEVINRQVMNGAVMNGVHPANYPEVNHFEAEVNAIESHINLIIEEADRFEQQAARFEESAGQFNEVSDFFRQISEIFEFAAMSLQEAVDSFETTPIVEADVADELDPLAEGIAIEDDNVPDQEVPDIEH